MYPSPAEKAKLWRPKRSDCPHWVNPYLKPLDLLPIGLQAKDLKVIMHMPSDTKLFLTKSCSEEKIICKNYDFHV